MSIIRIHLCSLCLQWLIIFCVLCLTPIQEALAQSTTAKQVVLPRSNDFTMSRVLLQIAQDPCHTIAEQEALVLAAREIAPAFWRPHANLANHSLRQGQWLLAYTHVQSAMEAIWHYAPHRSLVLAFLYWMTVVVLCGVTLAITTFFFASYLFQMLHQYTQQYKLQQGSLNMVLAVLALLLLPIALRLGPVGTSCYFLILIAPWLNRNQALLSSMLLIGLMCIPTLMFRMANQLEQSYGEASLAWRSLVEKQDPHLLPALSDRQSTDLNQQIAWLFNQHQLHPSDATTQAILQLLPQIEKNAEIWFLLGNGYMRLGKSNQAQQAYEKALLADAKHTPTLYHLSQILLKQEKKIATDYFEQLQQLNPAQVNQWQQLRKTHEIPFIQADGLQVLQSSWANTQNNGNDPLQRQFLQQFIGILPIPCLYGLILLTLFIIWIRRLPQLQTSYYRKCLTCGLTYLMPSHSKNNQCEDCFCYQHPHDAHWSPFQRLQYEIRSNRIQAVQRFMASLLYICLPGMGHLYRNRIIKGTTLLVLFQLSCWLIWISMRHDILESILWPLPSQLTWIGFCLLATAYGWSWLEKKHLEGIVHGA